MGILSTETNSPSFSSSSSSLRNPKAMAEAPRNLTGEKRRERQNVYQTRSSASKLPRRSALERLSSEQHSAPSLLRQSSERLGSDQRPPVPPLMRRSSTDELDQFGGQSSLEQESMSSLNQSDSEGLEKIRGNQGEFMKQMWIELALIKDIVLELEDTVKEQRQCIESMKQQQSFVESLLIKELSLRRPPMAEKVKTIKASKSAK